MAAIRRARRPSRRGGGAAGIDSEPPPLATTKSLKKWPYLERRAPRALESAYSTQAKRRGMSRHPEDRRSLQRKSCRRRSSEPADGPRRPTAAQPPHKRIDTETAFCGGTAIRQRRSLRQDQSGWSHMLVPFGV